jgi:hypothetical protein
LGGSINGPVGGAGGAISRVPNPSGSGNAAPDDASASNSSTENATGGDEVYVPKEGASGEEGTEGRLPGGPNEGTEEANTDGVGGRIGEGESTGAEVSSGTGEGGAVRVQTPYREVLADYAREATEAINRAYVPPDAKQYVKDYFSELGK